MNQRLFKHTWVATLLSAVMLYGLTACTSEDNMTKEQTAQEGPTYKVSIAAAIGNEAQTRADAPTKAETNNGWEIIDATAPTRAVSYNSTTGALESRFLTTEKIYVFYRRPTFWFPAANSSNQLLFLQPDAEGKTANLTGSLTFYQSSKYQEVSQGGTLALSLNADSFDGCFNYNNPGPQPGTLASLSNFDYAVAYVTVDEVSGSKDGGYTFTTSKASFQNYQSMYKLTFTGLDEGVGIHGLKIHSNKGKLHFYGYIDWIRDDMFSRDISIVLDDAARAANGPGVVYAALRFAAIGENETDDITFTVWDTNGKNYTVTKASPVGGFQNGKFYTSTINVNDTSGGGEGGGDNGGEGGGDNPSLVRVLADGETLTGTYGGASQISIADGASVTLSDLALSSSAQAGIVCQGSATITLVGTNNVSSSKGGCAGIQAGPAGSTLTIQGSGSLTATGADNGAGIGSGDNIVCGNIVIAGGEVTASGGLQAAGIGTGTSESVCGNITISGGTVTAIGHPATTESDDSGGAGIGSGGGSRPDSHGTSCGKITISGGTVTATGGKGCAGIGSGTSYSGHSSSEHSSCADIEISGGTVTATGGEKAAGIGSGWMEGDKKKYSKCGNILISGGTVTATCGISAIAIGCGKTVSASGCGTITITQDITKIVANNVYSNMCSMCSPIGSSSGFWACGKVTIDNVTYDNPQDVPAEYTYEHLKLTNNGNKIYTIQPK